ncbi:MAG: hypothetical protein ACHREM_16765 [Polyangiales bacterium]
MRKVEIEQWALRVIDAVVHRRPAEDERVELKSEWLPDDADFARRLAGHANSAGGEPILWLFGVDEKGARVPGATSRDFASWWPQVSTYFDGVAPTALALNIDHDGKVVVAVLVETDRAPFVVKNPQFGTKGVPIAYEVPWRENTSIRTARREDLIRLLVPAVKRPTFELHELRGYTKKPSTPNVKRILLRGSGYLVHLGDDRLYFPDHLATGTIRSANGGEMMLTSAKLKPRTRPDRVTRPWVRGSEPSQLVPVNPGFTRTDGDLAVTGPGMILLGAAGELAKADHRWDETPKFDFDDFSLTASINVEIRFSILGVHEPLVIRARLAPSTPEDDEEAAWKWDGKAPS